MSLSSDLKNFFYRDVLLNKTPKQATNLQQNVGYLVDLYIFRPVCTILAVAAVRRTLKYRVALPLPHVF